MVVLTCWGQYFYMIRTGEIEYFTLNIRQHWAPWWPAAGYEWPAMHFQFETR